MKLKQDAKLAYESGEPVPLQESDELTGGGDDGKEMESSVEIKDVSEDSETIPKEEQAPMEDAEKQEQAVVADALPVEEAP